MSTTAPTRLDPHHPPGPGGRHPVVVGHLVMGLAFLCFAAAWALVRADVVGASDVRWLLPVPWLVGGAAGLAVLTTRSLRRDSHNPPAGAATHSTDTDTDTNTATDLDRELR